MAPGRWGRLVPQGSEGFLHIWGWCSLPQPPWNSPLSSSSLSASLCTALYTSSGTGGRFWESQGL